jgi:hypothetical protein
MVLLIHLTTSESWHDPLALATFALAIGTFLLASYSRRDVAAQERPVVLVEQPAVTFWAPGERGPNRALEFRVSNAGRGPALNVATFVAQPQNLHVTDVPLSHSYAVGNPLSQLLWAFLDPPPPVPVRWEVWITYSDLSGRRFATVVEFQTDTEWRASSARQRVQRANKPWWRLPWF